MREEDVTDEDVGARVRAQKLTLLSDNHYVLRKAAFEYRRRDGVWQALIRESYDVGDGAAVLPIDRKAGKVLLIRQFRWPVFEAGYPRLLIEAVAGKLDGDEPQACVVREAMEEAGAAIRNPEQDSPRLHEPRRGQGTSLSFSSPIMTTGRPAACAKAKYAVWS